MEIGEFFRVGRRTVIRWQDDGELPYRLRLTNRGRVQYVRVTDSMQMSAFLQRKLPKNSELDPTVSATHRKLIWLRAKARRRSAAGLQTRRNGRDPTLRLVPEEEDTGKTNPSPRGPSDIDPGLGQSEPQPAPDKRQEADPYQGEGHGRSVAPWGNEEPEEG